MTIEAPLQLDVSVHAGNVRMRLAGDLDAAAEPVVVDRLEDALTREPGATGVELDLTGVSFVDSSGLRSLLLCRRRTDAAGVPLRLAVVDGPVTRLLRISGLEHVFTIEPPAPAA